MLRRHERRQLDEIENRLSAEDPEFARAMAGTERFHWSRYLRSRSAVLALISAVTALLCAGLGEADGFATAALLTLVLVATTRWKIRANEAPTVQRDHAG